MTNTESINETIECHDRLIIGFCKDVQDSMKAFAAYNMDIADKDTCIKVLTQATRIMTNTLKLCQKYEAMNDALRAMKYSIKD